MHDNLELSDKYVGPYSVESVDYSQCEECGRRLFPLETARRIEEKRELVLQEKIQSFPIKDFVTGVEAARILGITRQALHKNRRIRRGFIFQTRFSNKAVFLRKSVELFKKTGDGRFTLVEPESGIGYMTEHATTPVVIYVLTTSGGRRTRYVR